MKARKILIVLLFVLFYSCFAYGVSIESPAIIIKCSIEDKVFDQNLTCLNQDCSLNIAKESDSYFILNFPDSENGERFLNGTHFLVIKNSDEVKLYYYKLKFSGVEEFGEEFFMALDAFCVESIEDIKPVFEDKVEEWVNEKKSVYSGGHLAFEFYSKEREQELVERKNSLADCRYEDYERIGNWFASYYTIRDYCYLAGSWFPQPTLSHTEFIQFILSNPNSQTLPYLFGYLLFFAVVIGSLFYLYKRKELKKFFKPTKLHAILLFAAVLFSFILIIMFEALETIIPWIIGAYLFASIINYYSFRTKKN